MKEQYIALCQDEHAVPVFGKPWYLDIVCEKDWDVAITHDKEGRITGAWPYKYRKRRGFSFLQMPPYTPFLGPYLFYPEHIQSTYKQNSFYFNTIKALEKQLPKASFLSLKLAPENKVWYPLFSEGYVQTSRYTYVINSKIDIEETVKNLKPQLRNVVTKKRDSKDVAISQDFSGFLDLLSGTFQQNEIGQFFDREKMEAIIRTAVERKEGCLYSYKDMDAGIFVLQDSKKAYLLFTAKNELGRKLEGVGQLIWKAIKDSVENGRDFDFEGSMLPGVEKFFRSFGGKQEAYHQITKIKNPLMKVYKFLRG